MKTKEEKRSEALVRRTNDADRYTVEYNVYYAECEALSRVIDGHVKAGNVDKAFTDELRAKLGHAASKLGRLLLKRSAAIRDVANLHVKLNLPAPVFGDLRNGGYSG